MSYAGTFNHDSFICIIDIYPYNVLFWQTSSNTNSQTIDPRHRSPPKDWPRCQLPFQVCVFLPVTLLSPFGSLPSSSEFSSI